VGGTARLELPLDSETLNPEDDAAAVVLTVHDLVPGVSNDAVPQFTELSAGAEREGEDDGNDAG
jgi:hypothetical protein